MQKYSEHQERQKQVIKKIEESIINNKVSVVSPLENFDNDPRICLTSVHFPKKYLVKKINNEIVNPLRRILPEAYFYKPSSLHMTIKNLQVINYPPTFTKDGIKKAKRVFSEVITKHNKFNVYFFRLVLFPNSLSLFGTTDPELDNIFLDLDKGLKDAEIPDNKIYANKKYFISNMTLARFDKAPPRKIKGYVEKLSDSISFDPYMVDSVSLIIANASLARCKKICSWKLQD